MSQQGAAKLSISVPADLAKTVRKRVGSRGLGAFLDELNERLGSVPAALVVEARAAWPKRTVAGSKWSV
jgi:hypothetical protein